MEHVPTSKRSMDATQTEQPVSRAKSRPAVCLLVALLTFACILGNLLITVGCNETTDQTTSGSILSVLATPSPSPSLSPTPSPTPTIVPDIRVTITAVGDIILHKAVIDGARTNSGETAPVYDFSPDFQYVTSIIENSDLAIANFEGTLIEPPYTGWPSFGGPDAITGALSAAGFQVICTANNHCIDKGLDGLIRTATVFRDNGFTVIGTRPDANSSIDTVSNVEGIYIGMLNYTFESTGTAKSKSINGIPIPNGADLLINSFNPYSASAYEKDLKAIIARVDALRLQGAEMICLILHWGEEYTTHSAAWQRDMAQSLSDAGVDLIIGHHPHVLQEIDVLTSEVTGKQTLVYYSLGNFLGNWSYVTLGTAGKAQDGMIARITFLKTSDGVFIEKGEYIPTFVVRLPKGSGLQHLIVPVLPGLADPDAFQTTENEMQASYNRTHKILGPCVGSAEIPVVEAAQ